MIFFDSNVIVDCFIKKYSNGMENPRHKRAVELWKSISETKIISNLVRIEVINVLYLKHGKDKELIKKVYNGLLNDFEIIEDSEYYDYGFEKLYKSSGNLSLTDCIYLAVMEDYDIKKIVSFDPSFDDYKGVKRIH